MSSFENILLQQVELALMEDVGPGDLTTLGCVDERPVQAKIITRENGVLAGLPIVEAVLRKLDAGLEVKPCRDDGERFTAGETVAEICGGSRSLLTGERTALNFLGHLSGIATLTASFVDKVKGTKAVILDTRKTTPGLRYLEKYAVTCGGGENHRFGLFDMVLIKDNHIAFCGSITRAVAEVRAYLHSAPFRKLFVANPEDVTIEVEIDDQAQLREAIACGIKRILLDNQTVDSLAALVPLARSLMPDLKLEASGNVNLDNVAAIARTGVDYISIGALTHSAPAIDFSLELTT